MAIETKRISADDVDFDAMEGQDPVLNQVLAGVTPDSLRSPIEPLSLESSMRREISSIRRCLPTCRKAPVPASAACAGSQDDHRCRTSRQRGTVAEAIDRHGYATGPRHVADDRRAGRNRKSLFLESAGLRIHREPGIKQLIHEVPNPIPNELCLRISHNPGG